MVATELKNLFSNDAGKLVNLINNLAKGSVITSKSATILAQSIAKRKAAISTQVSLTQFIGRSSDNLCTVHATLPCKIFKVELDEKIKKLPKKLLNYYILR
jgi:hypothetical protein